MQTIKLIVIAFVSYVIFDVSWLMLFGMKIYEQHMGSIVRVPTNIPILLVAYFLLAMGIVFFVLPKAKGRVELGLAWGALFVGLVAAVYTLTNLSAINHWPPIISVLDIVMSTIVGGITGTITVIAENWLGRSRSIS